LSQDAVIRPENASYTLCTAQKAYSSFSVQKQKLFLQQSIHTTSPWLEMVGWLGLNGAFNKN